MQSREALGAIAIAGSPRVGAATLTSRTPLQSGSERPFCRFESFLRSRLTLPTGLDITPDSNLHVHEAGRTGFGGSRAPVQGLTASAWIVAQTSEWIEGRAWRRVIRRIQEWNSKQ